MNAASRAARAPLDTQPWYRQPWPWFLLAGPATVVVAGVITYVIAARTENAMVVDNYYKEGLAINRVLDANRNAAAHQYRAQVAWSATGGARVTLAGEGDLPATLMLSFVHPTHARFDAALPLVRVAAGEYIAVAARDDARALRDSSPRWYVRLQDDAGIWRLSGEWDLRQHAQVRLSAETR